MEDLRSSRRAGAAAKSAYGDVFGGPPKLSVPFVAKSDNYSEIFGGLASSCSIPFLDLPPTVDGSNASVDYSEIFGSFNGGDFAVNYEELFKESKKGPEAFSSNGWTPEELKFGQQAEEVSEVSPEGPSKDYVARSEKNQFSSSSNYSDDCSKHFSMSYHKTSRGSIEDVISGTAHVTHLHAVPGFSYVIDSCSVQDVRSDNPSDMPTNDLIHNVGYNGGSTAGEQGKIVPSTSSCDRTKSCGADLITNQKEYTTKCPASEDSPVNVKHHSRSSSNYSTSSGDISFPDVTYLTVSDISLRTQPSRVPPPSRAPPKFVNKQGHPKVKMYKNSRADLEEGILSKPMINHHTHYSLGASKSHELREVKKNGSPCFFDVEVDASSAAAASAAAMKEAMEQAQARLKSAKELMEKKREILQSRKKLGHNEAVKCDETKEDKAAEEVKSFSVVTTQKTLLKEDKKIKEFALDDRQKILRVAKAAPDHEEKERYVVLAEEDRQMMQENGFKSSQVPYKLEEISGEWKTEKQFYELINNEKKFRIIKEAHKQEGVEKKPETTTKVNEDKENYAKKAELTYQFERNGKLHEVNETSEREEIVENLKACNMASKEEIREIPNTILEACIWKENVNKPEEAHDFYQQKENEKLQPAQEAHVSGQELKKPNAGEGPPDCGESEKKAEPSNDASKFEGVHHDEEEKKLEAAKEAGGHEDSEKELGGTYVTCVPRECEKKLKMVRKTGMQDENENEIRVTSGTCMCEAGEKVVAVEEAANQYENSEKTMGNGKHESCHEENEYKLEGATSTLEQEESRKLNRIQESCMWVENDLVSRVVQDANEMEENSEKLKPAQGSMGHRENEKKMNSGKEACWQDYNEMKTREARLKLQRNEKNQKAAQAPSEPENSEELRVLEGEHVNRENEKVKEVHVALDSEETHNRLDAAREVWQSALNEDLEDVQQASLFKNKGYSQCLDQDATESHCTVLTENSTPDMHKAEERVSERIMEREREQEKEQARKLEEERERDREREKDRLAVERATREAHERALAEARERAERIAVERVTAEARQRALAEARDKAEKASAEALEKSLAEKALKEAKLRAERAAVERATAEARERAVEKALAEKAAADARQRAERLNATSRDRTGKDNESGEHFMASDKEDREIKLKPSSSDVPHDAQFQSASSSGSCQRYSDFYNHGGEGESPLRCKARLERHQRTVERAAKALAEKNLRDILAQREQAERNRLAESLDADVRRWSAGKEGNLRALLSTLQYILGPESGWQPMPLTDVITAAAVKKAYRKATLCVHPDKLQQRGASIQQKYICEKVFDLLKEAWNRFNSEEQR